MMRIAALASHGGSILQAVIDACETGELPAVASTDSPSAAAAGPGARRERRDHVKGAASKRRS